MIATSGFPTDEYTPHGYLANPFAVAHSWTEGEGGCLRTSREYVGIGWQLPWALRAQASVELVVTLEGGGQRFERRADVASAGLISPHHSASLFVYRWEALGRVWEAAYTLSEPHLLVEEATLGLRVSWTAVPDASAATTEVTLTLALVGWRRDGRVTSDAASSTVDLGEPFGAYELLAEGDSAGAVTEADEGRVAVQFAVPAYRTAGAAYALTGRVTAEQLRDREESRSLSLQTDVAVEEMPLATILQDDIRRARGEDDAFWAGAARLEGDWPDSWRRGWVYDVETTRMCVYPPGGIFTDIWPAWMVQWPRAVVAEGTLDMARLGYVSPDLALRATLSLFRDAEAPNVPCVFQDGEPNMVAADGAICGTSPAWCIPFYNLERLFAQTLDRRWLEEIYPYLSRYVEWWLAERTDADGWAVYKCTWEAGEDDNPRLDPERKGDNVVSAFVRPVELQATMALSAGVLGRFAAVLHEVEDVGRWRAIESAYLARTRELWDPTEGRFRDWDARHNRFLPPSGETSYWGVDTCRYSALAFTPLLAGLTDDAMQAGLRSELQHYAGPPWTLWASWSYVVLEAAPHTGDTAFAGRVAAEIVGRVYDELDAREPGGPSHPTPGVAREYWPLELDTWASCEGYGWGANTASLLVRQIFGFFEGPYLDESSRAPGLGDAGGTARAAGWRATSLTFDLRPALPDHLLVSGREYWLAGLPYRGGRLSLGYRIEDGAGALTVLVSANVPTRCQVAGPDRQPAYDSAVVHERHEIPGRNGVAYRVELLPGL
jgi:hypothetical protein